MNTFLKNARTASYGKRKFQSYTSRNSSGHCFLRQNMYLAYGGAIGQKVMPHVETYKLYEKKGKWIVHAQTRHQTVMTT